MRARWYMVGVFILPVVAIAILVLAFSDTDGCRDVSWWATWVGFNPIYFPPYLVVLTGVVAGWGYCLAKAASPRDEYAVAAAVFFGIGCAVGGWFLALLDAFEACPP